MQKKQTSSTYSYIGRQVVTSQKPNNYEVKDLKDLGAIIKYKRTSLGMSLKRTALLCEISDKTLRSIEKGANVNISTIIKTISMLGLNMKIEGV